MDNSLKFKAESIKAYISRLENDFQFVIIIDDLYDILKHNNFANFKNIDAWRVNDYCLTIKSDRHLHRRCVNLKWSNVMDILDMRDDAYELNCYLGVREYIVPIKVNNTHICTVSASGYMGDINPKTALAVCHRLNITESEFYALRESALNPNYAIDKEKLKTYLMVLADMLKDYLKALPETEKYTNKNEPQNQHLLKATNYIKQNCTKDITVKDIADVCFVSLSYLQHIFSKYRHHGINEEITRERLQYAEALLLSTDRQIKDIAYSSGFSNSDYFCTVFKKHYGISPLKYRKIKLTNKSKPYK